MADYDSPRPISQPEGSTDLAVAKDNLITLDKIAVSTDLEVTNRKGVAVTTFAGSTALINSVVADVETAKDQAIIDIDADVATVDTAKDAALVQIDEDLATVADEVNTINDSVAAAASSEANAAVSETNAAISASIAQSSANFVGLWSDQTGAATIPYSVYHDGNNWQLLTGLADVTASEPSSENSDWAIIVSVALPEPEVFLPLGNSMVTKIDGTLSFERLSSTYNINKSGVSELLDTDDPAITPDGLSIYESFENEILYSGDISNSAWSKVGVTASTNEMVEDLNESFHSVSQTASVETGTGYYTASFEIAQGAGDRSVRIRLADSGGYIGDAFYNIGTGLFYTTTTGVTTNTTEMNNGVVVISATVESSSGSPRATLYMVENGSLVSTHQGDGVSSIILNKCSLSQTEFVAPYVETTSETETRESDDTTLTLSGNMPQESSPFTMVVDANIKASGSGPIYSTSIQSVSSGFVLRESDGDVLFFISDGSSLVNLSSEIESGNRRVCVSFGSGILSLYIDGVLSSSETTLETAYDLDASIFLGKRITGSYLNSEIKNFKIYHSALTGAEVAQLGAAE